MEDHPGGPSNEPRQRWRIVFARDAEGASLAHAEAVRLWEDALAGSGLPIVVSRAQTPRPRLAFAAPLPTGMLAERELVDVALTLRLPRTEVWRHLAGRLPVGHRLVDLYDVWLGEPTLAARLGAADYRIVLRGTTADELDPACRRLLTASTLQRARTKGDGRTVGYDLRPLILGLSVVPAHTTEDHGAAVVARLRLGHELAAGRPDEVVLALAETLGRSVDAEQVVRERLLADGELELD